MDQSVIRITKELYELQKGYDLSLAAACRDSNVRHVRCLIIGPPDTPYEFGFFEFSVKFGRDYPTKAPQVICLTTNGGHTRFNPNIYAQGKVCLSILGTWRGEPSEEWSSAQGLESILISIQSLMSSNPYENEPGFETVNSKVDQKNQAEYNSKIRHETIRISIIDRLEEYLALGRHLGRYQSYIENETSLSSNVIDRDVADLTPFEPFKDKIKLLFIWYYDSYIQKIDREMAMREDGTKFTKMPFEGNGNIMDGAFQYSELRRRLALIRERLEQETLGWVNEGLNALSKELSVANTLQRQFEMTSEIFKKRDDVTIDLELVDNNPFLWQIVLFGRPMTNLDGGIFKIKMYISPRFPDEVPRVKVETPIFHHRVTKDGYLYYTNKNPEELKYTIEAVVSAIQDEEPAYDPRIVINPEAAKLFWGSKEDKKIYNRRLRRSAQESVEF